LEKNNQYYTKT